MTDSVMSCATCLYWKGLPPLGAEKRVFEKGLCRRFPPGPQGFPVTDRETWCGVYSKLRVRDPMMRYPERAE